MVRPKTLFLRSFASEPKTGSKPKTGTGSEPKTGSDVVSKAAVRNPEIFLPDVIINQFFDFFTLLRKTKLKAGSSVQLQSNLCGKTSKLSFVKKKQKTASQRTEFPPETVKRRV